MGKMWKYEPEDFGDDNNRKDAKPYQPPKPAESHSDSRQLKDYIPSTDSGPEFDNDGKSIHPEPEKPNYPPLNKNTWDH